IWFQQYIFMGAQEKVRLALSARLEEFTRDGIVHLKDGIITFRGDEFDRIYSKYFALQEKVLLSFPEFPYERFFILRMVMGFRSLNLEFLGGTSHSVLLPPTYAHDVGDAIRELPNTAGLKKLFDTYPVDLASDIYWTLLERSKSNQEAVDLVSLAVKTEWLNVELPFLFNGGANRGDREAKTHELSQKLAVMANRARSLG